MDILSNAKYREKMRAENIQNSNINTKDAFRVNDGDSMSSLDNGQQKATLGFIDSSKQFESDNVIKSSNSKPKIST
jgi:hypothetical protein